MMLSLMDKVGCGREAPTPIAEGLFDRSIFSKVESVCRKGEERCFGCLDVSGGSAGGGDLIGPACFVLTASGTLMFDIGSFFDFKQANISNDRLGTSEARGICWRRT